MILKTRDGLEVEVTDIDYGRYSEDTFFVSGYYTHIEDDEKAKVCDEVLDMLTEDYADVLYEKWYQHQIGCAEYMHEND